jgi:poly-D-alanine transfer protein DltD
MPTPQEKAAQTKEKNRLEAEKKKKEAAERAREREKLRKEEFKRRHTELQEYQSVKAAYKLLLSEVEGLYEEMDKLAKKAPNEPMTALQLKIINSFIRKSKKLMSGDTIIDEVEVFVSAGDNPEYRDAVTVLRQVRQGLDRYKAKNSHLFSPTLNQELIEHELNDKIPDDFFSVESGAKEEPKGDAESEPENGTAE